VIDNGVGIPPENLTRIFNHGFTTRKGGHGFGLHSGALAAKEMGGSLTVQSDGPGQGATSPWNCLAQRRRIHMNNLPETKTGGCWSLMTIAPSTMIFARFLRPAPPPPPWPLDASETAVFGEPRGLRPAKSNLKWTRPIRDRRE
jgi:hypothetical protein